ncbi:MAG: Dabb family protein [Acidimicrobiia bacterium]|nr:Dabb family protein [Acidimicrobiia bacterium]MDH5237027.1 Dabb family protein [Acidimicrobiia bacterium]
MLRHVVLLRFTPQATPAAVAAAVDALRTLPDSIDAIVGYEVGVDAGLAEDNASLVVLAEFADAEGWRRYQEHPDHQRVLAEHLRPILAQRLAVQFET